MHKTHECGTKMTGQDDSDPPSVHGHTSTATYKLFPSEKDLKIE